MAPGGLPHVPPPAAAPSGDDPLLENGREDEKASAGGRTDAPRVDATAPTIPHAVASPALASRTHDDTVCTRTLFDPATQPGLREQRAPKRESVTPLEGVWLSNFARSVRGFRRTEHLIPTSGTTSVGLVGGFDGEFDPGSGRTLAACLIHASRTLSTFGSYERVANG